MGTCKSSLKNNSSESIEHSELQRLPPLTLSDIPKTSEGRRWKSMCEKLANLNRNQRAYIAYLHDAQSSNKTNISNNSSSSSNSELLPTTKLDNNTSSLFTIKLP